MGVLSGCFSEAKSGYKAGPQPVGLNILALGDSYTIGTSVSAADRWPVLLQQRLIADGESVRAPEIIARNGWTTANLQAGLAGGSKRDRYDWVTLMIGVNNQFQGRSLDEFRQQLAKLIERSVVLAGGKPARVIVLSIPDWGVSDYGRAAGAKAISRDIARFNSVVKQQAAMSNVAFVDVGPFVEKARNDKSYLASDRLHFSRKMHALWAGQVFNMIKSSQ